MKFDKTTKALIIVPVLLAHTGCGQYKTDSDNSESGTEFGLEENREPYPDGMQALDPREQFLLVEQAVDSWMYFHLLDYSSYTPLIRSTDYDVRQKVHIHHIRYRAANAMGGNETYDKTFEVRLEITRDGLKDFDVKDISGTQNPTEIPQ